MELIETSTFTRQITALLTDEEYGEFQSRLSANLELGALIKGGGGIRKVRVAVGTRGRNRIFLLYAYPKKVTANLTPKQITQLAQVVKEDFGH